MLLRFFKFLELLFRGRLIPRATIVYTADRCKSSLENGNLALVFCSRGEENVDDIKE